MKTDLIFSLVEAFLTILILGSCTKGLRALVFESPFLCHIYGHLMGKGLSVTKEDLENDMLGNGHHYAFVLLTCPYCQTFHSLWVTYLLLLLFGVIPWTTSPILLLASFAFALWKIHPKKNQIER